MQLKCTWILHHRADPPWKTGATMRHMYKETPTKLCWSPCNLFTCPQMALCHHTTPTTWVTYIQKKLPNIGTQITIILVQQKRGRRFAIFHLTIYSAHSMKQKWLKCDTLSHFNKLPTPSEAMLRHEKFIKHIGWIYQLASQVNTFFF